MAAARVALAALLALAACFASAATLAPLRGPGCNCTATTPGVVGTGSLAHLENVASAAACCRLCQAEQGCAMWTYGQDVRACWLKDNARGAHPERARVSGACQPPPPPPVAVPVRVALGGVLSDAALPEFVSFTLDWWAPTQGCRPGGWGPHANVLELDFASPKLRALVSAMAPAFLRIGGSLDKDVVYAVPGSGVAYNSTGCPLPLCMNASRWDELHAFANATGVRVVFGLSYPTNGTAGVWNSSQAEALMRYSRARGYDTSTTLYGFELGEELTSYKENTSAFAAYTRAYHECAALMRSTWPADRPRLQGPCPGMSWPQLATWMPAFLRGTAGALDTVVYHSYNQIEPEPPRALYLNLTCPAGAPAQQHGVAAGATGWQAAAMRGYARAAGLPLWLGEGGDHNGGGGGTFAGTFVDSFYYLDALGVLSEQNHSAFGRQTLVGGNYELLRCSGGEVDGAGCDFEPNPDYWVALLWRRLMGQRTLAVMPASVVAGGDAGDASDTSDLRLHAHCAASRQPGAVALSWSNMNDAGRTFVLDMSHLGPRQEWTLTSANASLGFGSKRVVLNNAADPLATLGAGGATLPPLPGHNVTAAAPLVAGPGSLGFALFPAAGVESCPGSQAGGR